MLASIFSALPQGSMLKALQAVGISVGDPMESLAPDDESNQIDNWNMRRVQLDGTDARGPVYDKAAVLAPKAVNLAQPKTPPYLSPEYDNTVGMMGTQANLQGGF